jgi:TolB-like protein/DNA-binding winged helix-turn-helix (wHTH) protein
MLQIGAWSVDPSSGQISREGETARLEERPLRLLLYLAGRAGQVVSIDELLDHVWSGVAVSQDSVYQAVASLRRQLGDDPKQPTYIATVPRLGYRMVATVGTPAAAPERKNSRRWAAAALCIALIALAIFLFRTPSGNRHPAALAAVGPQKSIAVLPFLDLTDKMSHEIFADGMTEELIDKFSKVPGLQVAPPTSSFYFKNKQLPVAEIAERLGVAYVLDGSVRKSGPQLRVAARLIRADNGYVVWSETYDRPFNDLLKVQDDIAGEVTKALKTTIEGR